jgi:2-polyprenyl-3-methyl-5-hydroxy-6-metoxy-1,4-benzoquinol methylase
MDYASYEPDRYAPDLATAGRQGAKDLAGIAGMIGASTDQRILEVGCGCGCLLVALRHRGYTRSLGVDQDPALVQHGRAVLGVDIVQGGWRTYLEGAKASFDAIIALDVLEHLSRDELLPTLKITRERLTSGGRLILRTPNALCPLVLPLLYGDLSHQSLVTPRLMVHLLRRAGFDGAIGIYETRPAGRAKRLVHALVHGLLVKPLVQLAYYHFAGEFPRVITQNMIVCTRVAGETGTRMNKP